MTGPILPLIFEVGSFTRSPNYGPRSIVQSISGGSCAQVGRMWNVIELRVEAFLVRVGVAGNNASEGVLGKCKRV